MFRRLLLFVVVVSIGAILAAPHFRDREHEVIDEAARVRRGGTYLETTDGITRYELLGAENEQTIVLIHGVSGPMAVWDATARDLAARGYAVLRYDLFGRGASDRPSVRYDEALYDRQLKDLFTALSIWKPVILVGSSMGAIVAAGFRNRHPERVRGLVLVGPAGFPIEAPPAAQLLRLPLLGDYLMRILGDDMLVEHHRRYFVRPERHAATEAAFSDQLRVRGTKAAILSTWRHMPLQNYATGYGEVGRSGTPTLLIWGEQDETFPFANHDVARRLVPQAAFLPVPDAAHLPQLEAPELVNRAIAAFARATLR